MTLLDKAKELGGSRQNRIPVTKEEVEVIVAYLNGEISVRQYGHAIGIKDPGRATHRISSAMYQAVKAGWIKIQVLV